MATGPLYFLGPSFSRPFFYCSVDVLVHTPFECANVFLDVSTVVRRAYDKLFSLLD